MQCVKNNSLVAPPLNRGKRRDKGKLTREHGSEAFTRSKGGGQHYISKAMVFGEKSLLSLISRLLEDLYELFTSLSTGPSSWPGSTSMPFPFFGSPGLSGMSLYAYFTGFSGDYALYCHYKPVGPTPQLPPASLSIFISMMVTSRSLGCWKS